MPCYISNHAKLNAFNLEPGSLVMLDDIEIFCSLNLDVVDLFDP